MTAYQVNLAEQARALTNMVEANLASPAGAALIGLKAALRGDEITLPIEDLAEAERRFRSIRVELKADGDLQEYLARRVATMTVRVERSVRLETASLSDGVRKAVARFDTNRFNEALRLYDWITADPLTNSRKLHETIEGVDRMIKAFRGLKDDLLHSSGARWRWNHLEKVENLMSRRLEELPISRAKSLSEAVGGDFQYLEESDGAGLEDLERRAWARARLADLIDVEVARLEAFRTSFDPVEVARERDESVDRALFDPSKEATQARKYEAAAERSLYRAMRELRQLQAEKARVSREELEEPEPELGSFFPGAISSLPDRPAWARDPAGDRPSERPKHPTGTRKSRRAKQK